MTDKKLSLGAAIDQIVAALESLEERSRLTAIHAACDFLGLKTTTPDIIGKPASHNERDTVGADKATHVSHAKDNVSGANQIDIRKFTEEKKPTSARQMACLVAYYLQELAPIDERKDAISVEDLEKYFKQAKFRLPEKIAQVLVATKSAGYMDSTARGQYKLNAVGYNLVAHNLPSSPNA